MDTVDKENVKIPNAVIVSGITNTAVDEELTDFLNQYGRIARKISVDEPQSPFHKNAIVEYESGAALRALEHLLPHSLECSSDVTYQIRALSTEYISAFTDSATNSFFSELQKIAKLSGKSFEAVLHEHLSKCAQSVGSSVEPPETSNSTSETQSEPTTTDDRQQSVNDQIQHETIQPISTSITSNTFRPANVPQSVSSSGTPTSLIHHPDVQKVVVEHIVRSEAPISHANASFRLKQFSGKVPCPPHEADFDTWRHSVELILQDPDLSDLHRSRKILDSLAPPAANVVKPLGPKALPAAYLELLTSAFGTVEDGEELFVKFVNTFQDPGEKSSHYLHRLQTALTKVLNRGGILASEADRHLLRQFCRGCWDNVLLADLQLEKMKENPPTFTNLLLQLRIEEDKQNAKESRMKSHFAATRPKVASHAIAENDSIPDTDLAEVRSQITEIQKQLTKMKPQKERPQVVLQNDVVTELKAQIAELQSHIARLKPESQNKRPNTKTKAESKGAHQNSPASKNLKSRPKPWYCFQCGEDGHIISSCSNDPNPSLVADKRKQLKEKQSLWDRQNSPKQTLN
ncbi:zinc finger CCHC domain-containing protein 12-like [Corythoichthys intestinalis]|uniref:zinc finger CCHC domain-containing protein 12-like n=1 Tax=Corythoichthys intestinalis TaxID=161448 RepID=UPI0025A4FE32|nr:zinc finger CCHC domain-containing protein 12-like [Corythoichthys intestinalis]XP_057701771.1 zinc finger CCHC domain-containing protein 12-like [Corythoichthys intestinalis]